jgi:hypothetical protein
VLAKNNLFFDPDKDTKSKSCGDDYDEETYHVLYECTKYNDSRTKLIVHLPNQKTVSFCLVNTVFSLVVDQN